ncbi:variable large family protein (plasmid) [Borrelia sp. P9F1]|nr:variable large family protein [Borrelia sp. P9F1]WKC58611.1 variable large family protein [Borrelia sp. P9F1]
MGVAGNPENGIKVLNINGADANNAPGAGDAAKAASVSGGIALRAILKGGKLAANNAEGNEAAAATAISFAKGIDADAAAAAVNAAAKALRKSTEEIAGSIGDTQDIGDTNAAAQAAGAAPADTEISKFHAAIKAITEVAKGQGVDTPAAASSTTVTVAATAIGGAGTPEHGIKVLNINPGTSGRRSSQGSICFRGHCIKSDS